jgi:hypothetical protein
MSLHFAKYRKLMLIEVYPTSRVDELDNIRRVLI